MVLITRLMPILPVSIKFFKRNSKPINPITLSDPLAEETPLLELEDDPQTSAPIRRESVRGKLDAATFDLRLAKLSLVVDIITYFGMAFAQTGWQFTTCSIFGAFGMGFNPAMQSLTLALYTRRGGTESGKLFGALSVIHAFRYVGASKFPRKTRLNLAIARKFWVRPYIASYTRGRSQPFLVRSSSSLSLLLSSPSDFYSWSDCLRIYQ